MEPWVRRQEGRASKYKYVAKIFSLFLITLKISNSLEITNGDSQVYN